MSLTTQTQAERQAPILGSRAGTPHPLSPASFPSSEAFQAFCDEHYPFGCKTAEEAEAQLAASRLALAVARKNLSWFRSQGDMVNVRRLQETVRDQARSVRNGEVYFAALAQSEAA